MDDCFCSSLLGPDDKFLNLLMRAQSRQLDSQRGMLRKEDLQMPDFLKENCDTAPSFQALDVTPTPNRCLSLDNDVENTNKNGWSHNIRVANSVTSMEESSRSSSESTSTDHEWNVDSEPAFGSSNQDIIHRLSRTARQADVDSKNAESNASGRCDGIAEKTSTQRRAAVGSSFSSKFTAARFEPTTTASNLKTDISSAVMGFRSSYV